MLGASYLLKSAAFLAIWFLFLWLVLRWDTQRRVSKLLAKWKRLDSGDAASSPAAAALAWTDELLDPIRTARQREQHLLARADALREQLHDVARASSP